MADNIKSKNILVSFFSGNRFRGYIVERCRCYSGMSDNDKVLKNVMKRTVMKWITKQKKMKNFF